MPATRNLACMRVIFSPAGGEVVRLMQGNEVSATWDLLSSAVR